MNFIEKNIKIDFITLTPPSLKQIVEASLPDITNLLQKVDNKTIQNYESVADSILQEIPSKEALCRALAVLSGHHQGFEQMSLINGNKGLVTFEVTGPFRPSMNPLLPLFKLFDPFFDPEEKKPLLNIRRIVGGGFVFDVEKKFEATFLSIANEIEAKKFSMTVCEELPSLEPFQSSARNSHENRLGQNRRNERDWRDDRRSRNNDRFDRPRMGGWSRGQNENFGRISDRENRWNRNWENDSRFNFSIKNGLFGQNTGVKSMMLSSRSTGSSGRIGVTTVAPRIPYCPRRLALGFYSCAGIYWFFKN